MQTGLVHLHNLLRWVILILLVISVVKSYTGWKGGKSFNPGDRKIWLFTMIAAHSTLLLGLYQWLAGRMGIINTELPEGVSMMKDKTFRFFWLEHPLMMLIAIALITLGYGMAKKPVPDTVKYQKAFRYFLIALLLILLVTPWPFREVIGRPLFPGM
jgi:hypothetical protein